jgi:hypothetical protein
VVGFLKKVPNFYQYVLGPSYIYGWTYIPSTVSCPSYSIAITNSYSKNAGAATSTPPGFAGYSTATLIYTTIQQLGSGNAGNYLCTHTLQVTKAGYPAVTLSYSFTINVLASNINCSTTVFTAPTYTNMSNTLPVPGF